MGFQPWRPFGRPFGQVEGHGDDAGEHITSMSSRILTTQLANMVAYWKLDEATGTALIDSSPNGANGAYSGSFALNQDGIGDGSKSALFSGGFGNLTAGLTALNLAFLSTTGTLFAWCKVTNAAVWTDGAFHVIAELGADVNNRVLIYKTNVNSQLQWQYLAGGTNKSITLVTSSPLGFISVAITWDKVADQVNAYFGGIQTGATLTGLGVWVGALAAAWTAIANEKSTSALDPWSGSLAHVAAWKVALTAAEIARIGVLSAS